MTGDLELFLRGLFRKPPAFVFFEDQAREFTEEQWAFLRSRGRMVLTTPPVGRHQQWIRDRFTRTK